MTKNNYSKNLIIFLGKKIINFYLLGKRFNWISNSRCWHERTSLLGWMHNRVRMIVGSFLVKHLLINWKEGEKYFKNCLLDCATNNVSGWQWVAGSGADAAPYFRIFNPILQGEKFDKKEIMSKGGCRIKESSKKIYT